MRSPRSRGWSVAGRLLLTGAAAALTGCTAEPVKVCPAIGMPDPTITITVTGAPQPGRVHVAACSGEGCAPRAVSRRDGVWAFETPRQVDALTVAVADTQTGAELARWSGPVTWRLEFPYGRGCPGMAAASVEVGKG